MFNRRTALEPTTKLSYEALHPPLRQTAVMRSPFFSVFVRLSIVVSLCVGLVALLQFFIWLCAFGKTANVLPNALAILRF